jgi:hypothetical protein
VQALQRGARDEHGGMFGGLGDDVRARVAAGQDGAADREVVGF